MKQSINDIFKILLNKDDALKILKMATKYPIVLDKLKEFKGEEPINIGLEMSDLGF